MQRRLATLVLAVCFVAACKRSGSRLESHSAAKADTRYDTIYFGSPALEKRYRQALTLPGAEFRNEAVLLPSRGRGQNVWPDSLLYLRKGANWLVALATMVGERPQVLYYSGDSLRAHPVSTDEPSWTVHRTHRLDVLHVWDSTPQAGPIVVSHHFFVVDTAGMVTGPVSYYPTRWPDGKGEHRPIEFTITARAAGDSILILSDGKVERVFQ